MSSIAVLKKFPSVTGGAKIWECTHDLAELLCEQKIIGNFANKKVLGEKFYIFIISFHLHCLRCVYHKKWTLQTQSRKKNQRNKSIQTTEPVQLKWILLFYYENIQLHMNTSKLNLFMHL